MKVNAHTHLELSWAAHLCPEPPGVAMPQWLANLDKHWGGNKSLEEEREQTLTAVSAGIAQLKAAGVTHVGDISNTGLSIEPLLDSGLAGVVYIEVWGLDKQVALDRFAWARQLLEKWRPQERNGLRIGLTPHASYTVHPDVMKLVGDYAQKEGVPLSIHVAEFPQENQALLEGKGQTYEVASRNGPVPVVGMRSVPYLASLGVLDAKPLLAHAVSVTDEDLDILAASGSKIAHCPRSNLLLQCGRMPLEKMVARAIPLAFGTDSLASSPSLDVADEAETAVSLHAGLVGPTIFEKMLENRNVFV